MPVYEMDCLDCQVAGEYYAEVADCYKTPDCPHCGKPTRKVIRSAPKGYMVGQFDTFRSTVDGSLIASKRALEEHNKRNNVVSLADGYNTEQLQNMKGLPKEQPSDVKADLVEAYQAVKQGYKPPTINESDTLH